MSEETKKEINTNAEGENKQVKKVVHGLIEKLVDKIAITTLGRIVPSFVTPNLMTAVGAIGGLFGIVCAFLAKIHPLFLIGTCFGVCTHMICDSLDGYIARKRNISSKAGAYFDLLTDILHLTYLLIALAFSNVIDIRIVIFLVPVYALIIFTSMNEIHYLNVFSFPTLGPNETQLFFIALLVGSMITGCKPLFEIKGFGVKFGDIAALVGGIPMYFEMIRLQITIFNRIKKQEQEEE
ncbi:MAG: CDP-alcohol phosphatidyltransferase family protein [Lachnospiraceae bacterium]|nr:CDP-alcohol phosphatidyltransferase family protein [Lachnospiraceae bacterium]